MEQLPQNIKCIIFDLDGTLAGFEKRVHNAYIKAFTAIDSEKADTWTMEDTHAQNGRPRQEIFSDSNIWGDKGAEAETAFYKEYKTNLALCQDALYEGAVELLEAAQKTGARLVLLGAKTESLLIDEARVLGIAQYFNKLQGNTDDTATNKPYKGAFDKALDGLEITDSRQVVYVGDNPKTDIGFANSWGATPIIVRPEHDKNALRDLTHLIQTTYPVASYDNGQRGTGFPHTRA